MEASLGIDTPTRKQLDALDLRIDVGFGYFDIWVLRNLSLCRGFYLFPILDAMHDLLHFRMLGKIVAQIALGISLVFFVVFCLDYVDAFDESDRNHNEQCWVSLYDLGEAVDVLFLGNSRTYTGVNAKQLSAATGLTSFVLGNDGILMKDAYWNLREALTVCSPKLILVETGMMNFLETKSDVPAVLFNSIQAYAARQNSALKWRSLFDLFTPEEAIYAVSKTLRNHHVILKDPDRFKANIRRGKSVKDISAEKLYLGSYVRYTESLTDSTFRVFERLGPAVTASNTGVSAENVKYAHKIIELAESHGIKIAFVSLPIFEKNVTASVAQARAENIQDALAAKGPKILNLIDSHVNRNPEFFENTRSTHQHFTLKGSMAITRLIGDWINQTYLSDFVRPGWNGEASWHELFEAEEGYLSYFPASTDNKSIKYQLKNVLAPQISMDEVLVFEVNNTRRNSYDCFVKVRPTLLENKGLRKHEIALTLEVSNGDGPREVKTIGLQYDQLLEQSEMWVFRSAIPRWTVHSVLAARRN